MFVGIGPRLCLTADLLDAQLREVTLSVVEDESLDPVRVGLLRVEAVVAQARDRADAIQ